MSDDTGTDAGTDAPEVDESSLTEEPGTGVVPDGDLTSEQCQERADDLEAIADDAQEHGDGQAAESYRAQSRDMRDQADQQHPLDNAELEQELEDGLHPASPDAKPGPGAPGRATPARGGSGARPATSNPHRYGTSGGGGGGGGSRGGGGGSTGKGNSFSLFNFNLGSIFKFGNVLSGNKNRTTTGIVTGGGRRPAPRRRPAATRTSGARSVLYGRPAWRGR